MVNNLSETNEERLVAAHQAGIAYWRHNRVRLDKAQCLTVARSCGWHNELAESWAAGFFGAERRGG